VEPRVEHPPAAATDVIGGGGEGGGSGSGSGEGGGEEGAVAS